MNCVPCVHGFLGMEKGGWTEATEFSQHALDKPVELLISGTTIRQAYGHSFITRELASGKDKFGGALLTDEGGKGDGCDWRITCEFDFRKSPGRIARRVNHIANHGEFRASSETGAADGGDSDFARSDNGADCRVKTREHFADLLREMGFDIDTCGENGALAFEDDNGDICARLDFAEGLLQLSRHLEIDYV